MSLFNDRGKSAWSKVSLVILVSWCLFSEGEANQNGPNNQAQLKSIGIVDDSVEIQHKGRWENRFMERISIRMMATNELQLNL